MQLIRHLIYGLILLYYYYLKKTGVLYFRLQAYSECNFSVWYYTVVEDNLINASRLVFLLLLTVYAHTHTYIFLYYNIYIYNITNNITTAGPLQQSSVYTPTTAAFQKQTNTWMSLPATYYYHFISFHRILLFPGQRRTPPVELQPVYNTRRREFIIIIILMPRHNDIPWRSSRRAFCLPSRTFRILLNIQFDSNKTAFKTQLKRT